MPEQPSPIADTRKPCPNCRYFIGGTSINYTSAPLVASLGAIFAAEQGRLRRNASDARLCHVALRACGRLDCPQAKRKKRRTAMGTLSRLGFVAGATLLFTAGSAMAQPVDMAAAKREGKVVWYCS